MEATASSERLQRRRIDDGELAGPARSRRRWRRLGEELGLQLLLDDEVEGEEHDGLTGLSSSARWPRRPRRCAPVKLRAATDSSGRERRRALEGGNGGGVLQGVSRREKEARGGLDGGRRGRVAPGWLGGIPPSSLGAREGEEDAAAPVGRLGWVGRLRPGRQVSFSFYFLFNLSFLFLYFCFGSDKNIKPFYKMLKLFM